MEKKTPQIINLAPYAINKLNEDYTDFWEIMLSFISKEKINMLDGVASHGHTVFSLEKRSTLQIGNLSHLADRVGLPIICDFRIKMLL